MAMANDGGGLAWYDVSIIPIELFTQGLGLQAPWRVSSSDFNVKDGLRLVLSCDETASLCWRHRPAQLVLMGPAQPAPRFSKRCTHHPIALGWRHTLLHLTAHQRRSRRHQQPHPIRQSPSTWLSDRQKPHRDGLCHRWKTPVSPTIPPPSFASPMVD
jgi:hypothetical protein